MFCDLVIVFGLIAMRDVVVAMVAVCLLQLMSIISQCIFVLPIQLPQQNQQHVRGLGIIYVHRRKADLSNHLKHILS